MRPTATEPSTLQRANQHMSQAVMGPATAGANAVAGMLSPFNMGWMAMTPPALWPAFLGTVYVQGTRRGLLDAPKHYFTAMNLYAQAATEGARASRA